MIPRYTPKDLSALWSSDRRYAVWLEVELAACEAMEDADLVPKGTAARIREKKLVLDADRIDEIERTTKHDVIAFLTHVEELVGADARWLHRGMTSSDVLDTSFAILLRDAADSLVKRTDALLVALAKRAREHAKTPMIGRSHGIFAEPVTFGLALAGHYAELARGGRGRHLRASLAGHRKGGAHEARLEARDREHADRPARSARRAVLRDGARRGGHRALRDERAPLAAIGGG